jgi:hypothetical protein
MNENLLEIGAIKEVVAVAGTVTELAELQLALVGGGFGEVVLV